MSPEFIHRQILIELFYSVQMYYYYFLFSNSNNQANFLLPFSTWFWHLFLSPRFWVVLYQRLFLGKLPWGNPLDHFGNCSSSSAFPNSMLARQGGLLIPTPPPPRAADAPLPPMGGRRPPTPLRSANDPTPSGPRLITSIKPTSEWECLLTDRISWKFSKFFFILNGKIFFCSEWSKNCF